MALLIILWCAAVLLGLGVLGVALSGRALATRIVYGGSLLATLVALASALAGLLGHPDSPPTVILPIGLPWIGANFRLHALSALFAAVVNLGSAMASLFGLGYGQHEEAPGRVLPFYPAFLAGMNLVVLADDAFTFLLSWEFMSLSSWALVMAHHRIRDNVRAGY